MRSYTGNPEMIYDRWRAGCGETQHVRVGGGRTEKVRDNGTSPAAYPTEPDAVSSGRAEQVVCGRESRPRGEGGQVSRKSRGGRPRNARDQNLPGNRP